MHILMLLLLGSAFTVNADVYRCEREDGSVYYQDTSCGMSEQQTKLLCQVDPIPQKTIDKLQREHKRRVKAQDKQQKAVNKQAAKKRQKKTKQQQQCAKTKRELAKVRDEYRNGYTAKRRELLDRRLAVLKQKRQQNCAGT